MDSAPELNMTPQETVDALDRYIIGQNDAKKAVAVALRNRWRRLQLDEDLKDEILPKNIIMIGATGIGKTEIARRISKLVNAPFVKVEASKFTEVGYVGRDVESMIRDLTDSIKDAKGLISLLHGMKFKINLIPFNSVQGSKYLSPSQGQSRKFQKYLLDHGVVAPIRISKGQDIQGACGQLVIGAKARLQNL